MNEQCALNSLEEPNKYIKAIACSFSQYISATLNFWCNWTKNCCHKIFWWNVSNVVLWWVNSYCLLKWICNLYINHTLIDEMVNWTLQSFNVLQCSFKLHSTSFVGLKLQGATCNNNKLSLSNAISTVLPITQLRWIKQTNADKKSNVVRKGAFSLTLFS